MNFTYSLPVRIVFGRDRIAELAAIVGGQGWSCGLLVADPVFVKNGLADRLIAGSGGTLVGTFSGLSPNPDVSEVDKCVAAVRESGADFLVALGGGSSMDCAKAASVICKTDRPARHFHSEKGVLPGSGLPLVAVPTTAGTGSEVTNVSVLTDAEKKFKGPMLSDGMYARVAIIDPVLTLSVPPQVTAATGLDVLSHALEGFWSKNHQPICDANAIYAARLVFEYLYRAYQDGSDVEAREQMSVASLMAGLAFAHPKTAASHACSFPLTNVYKMPHGEACAFTLDSLIRINAGAEGGRVERFARQAGFADAGAMADRTLELKKLMKMKCSLDEAGIAHDAVEQLADWCEHPNLHNNPVEMTREKLVAMFAAMER